jgi:hypothetical protein
MTDYEEFVPRPKIAREFGVSHRSICRWEKEKRPGFDQAVKIGKSLYFIRGAASKP